MLDEQEWEELVPHLRISLKEVKEYREKHRASIEEAKASGYGKTALETYYKLTGFRETNVDALWHHRLSLFGPPCHACSKPLRTPSAKLCAECGSIRPNTPIDSDGSTASHL